MDGPMICGETPEQRQRRIVKYYEEVLGVAEADIPRYRADWAELYGQREVVRPGAHPELPPSGRMEGVGGTFAQPEGNGTPQ